MRDKRATKRLCYFYNIFDIACKIANRVRRQLLVACILLILPKLYGWRLTLRNEVYDNFIVIRWARARRASTIRPFRDARRGATRHLRAVVECVGKWEGCRTLWTAGRRSLWAWVTMVTLVTDRRPILEPKVQGGNPNAKRSAKYCIWLYNWFYIPDCYAYATLLLLLTELRSNLI